MAEKSALLGGEDQSVVKVIWRGRALMLKFFSDECLLSLKRICLLQSITLI